VSDCRSYWEARRGWSTKAARDARCPNCGTRGAFALGDRCGRVASGEQTHGSVRPDFSDAAAASGVDGMNAVDVALDDGQTQFDSDHGDVPRVLRMNVSDVDGQRVGLRERGAADVAGRGTHAATAARRAFIASGRHFSRIPRCVRALSVSGNSSSVTLLPDTATITSAKPSSMSLRPAAKCLS
jgi:hypothetical protein